MWYQITEEQRRVQETAKQVAKEIAPLVRDAEERGGFSPEAIRIMQKAGLLSIFIPKEYGGGGRDVTTSCLAQEQLAKVDAGLANLISDQSVSALIIGKLGREDQKRKCFPKIVKEEKLWCFAATEPGAGSDLGSIQTRAIRDGDTYVLNGTKSWASMGEKAELYVIMGTIDPAKRLGGLTAFIVERGTSGLQIGRTHPVMGWKTMPAVELTLDNVRVPTANRISEEGDGFRIFMVGLNVGRVGIAAQSIGVAEGALDCALEYAKSRVQFGRPIAEFQAVRFMLADMATEIEASRSLTYTAAWLVDHGHPEVEKFCAMAKYFVSDLVMKITVDAVQILGAVGWTRDYPVEKMMRDAKAFQIADGTNQIMRVVVSRSIIGKA